MKDPTRRDVLAGSAGLWLAENLGAALAQEAPASRTAEHAILVWLDGGPSHLDTFDPKPGHKNGGPVKAIPTVADGIRLSEYLPQLAAQMKHASLVRSLTSKEEDHGRAFTYLHTGNIPQETVSFPSLGAVIASETAVPANDLPSFVNVGGGELPTGFLGVGHSAFTIPEAGGEVANLARPENVRDGRHQERLAILRKMNERFGPTDQGKVQEAAVRFLDSKAAQAFDLGQEVEALRAAYGDSPVGRGCLLARRLVEQGVRFVEVSFGGWDTHENNFDQTAQLCGQLDPALANLLRDLREKGLLDKTLVLCMGEFGRTPEINAGNGRDHWARAFSALVAGGGIKGGRVVGATDEAGMEPAARPVTIPDLFATVMAAFGVNPKKTYRTPNGRPIKLVEKGTAVTELTA